jgi:hypothetical protein
MRHNYLPTHMRHMHLQNPEPHLINRKAIHSVPLKTVQRNCSIRRVIAVEYIYCECSSRKIYSLIFDRYAEENNTNNEYALYFTKSTRLFFTENNH